MRAQGDPWRPAERWQRLEELRRRAAGGGPLRVLGLMSGTSADGVDAACVLFEGRRAQLLGTGRTAFRRELREALLGAAAVPAGRLPALARDFAEAAVGAARAAAGGRRPDLVASHGQTILHRPAEGLGLQLDAPQRLAEALGAPVVHDFRSADLLLGGQGAPLVPLADLDLFGDGPRPLLLLNLGGIMNLTWIGPAGELLAWDLGPANTLLDRAVRRFGGPGAVCDEGGRLAAQGRARPEIVEAFLGHPYFRRPPPKSTGPEDFGDRVLDMLLQAGGETSLPDLLASLCAAQARVFSDALSDLAAQGRRPRRVLVAGGGVENKVLFAALARAAAGIPFGSLAACGFDPRYREAACFAALGRRALLGLPLSLPETTGAPEPLCLGRWAFPSRGARRSASEHP